MKAFHEGTYQERFASMGDEAESQFEAYNTQWARYGFNRPEGMTKFHYLPHVLRYTPDYIQADPTRLVEVVGMGKTPLKFKMESSLRCNGGMGQALQYGFGSGHPPDKTTLSYPSET